MNRIVAAALLLAGTSAGGASPTQSVPTAGRSIPNVVQTLKSGEYLWTPAAAMPGSKILVVNLSTQRAMLFRNGVAVAATTVSTGRPGYDTPTGAFTILEKRKVHFSSTYDNAPMPNMQRLTWKGISLHAGKLPGFPASHGCIRLPPKFSELLFGATSVGMTVVITKVPAALAPTPGPLFSGSTVGGSRDIALASFEWRPSRARNGAVSIIVSTADQRAVVLRGGVQIGSAPVRVFGDVGVGWAYVMQRSNAPGQQWLKLRFDGPEGAMEAPEADRSRFEAPTAFRNALRAIMQPGTVVIVTPGQSRPNQSDSAPILEGEVPTDQSR